MKATIGFDLGSSHCIAAGVDAEGKLITGPLRTAINCKKPAGQIIRAISCLLSSVREEVENKGYMVIGCAGGAPGPMDMDTGTILDTPNLVTLQQFPLSQALGEKLDLPIFLNNDANLITFGEAQAGAGQSYKSVYGCTLGGGFGHGWIIDGRIFVGQHFLALEHAKSPLAIDSQITIEDVVSGRGISDSYNRLVKDGNFDPEQIASMAFAGDEYAILAYTTFGRWLGFALSWIQNTLDVDVMLVGGNIAQAWELFSPSMLDMLHQHTWRKEYEVPVLRMALGENAGIIGGGLLAFSKIGA